jgi:hypothetical protein
MMFIAGRAHEGRDEQVRGRVVDLLRRAQLLHVAVVHHRDPGGQGHRLDLVVRDVDDRGPELLVQLLDLGPHVDAELGVEVRQRLVEEEHVRVPHERPPHRHALPLPARKLAGLAAEEMVDLQKLATSFIFLSRSGFGTPCISSPKVMFCPTVMLG